MTLHPDVPLQRDLFGATDVAFDGSYAMLRRVQLDAHSWVEHVEEWVTGADELFRTVLASRAWSQRTRRLYDREVLEPRLTAPWSVRSGVPLEPAILAEMRASLSARYGIDFDSVGFNLYRDGRDGVAWHRDKIRAEVRDPLIVLVSLGERRKLFLRPRGGGRSRAFLLGRGDLLVTGGRTNREWEHTVPKVARAGPRISLAFRHGLDPRGYGREPSILPSD
jgi:alkylated DNA repair dioxygenase AlkB